MGTNQPWPLLWQHALIRSSCTTTLLHTNVEAYRIYQKLCLDLDDKRYYDRLRKTRKTVYVLACVTTWLVYLHGGKLDLLPKVTVDVDNIKLDNDVMTIR